MIKNSKEQPDLSYAILKLTQRRPIFPDWRRHAIPGFITFGILVVVLAVGASLGYVIITQNAYDYPVVGTGLLSQQGFSVFAVGAFVGAALTILLIALRLISDDLYEALTDGLFAKGRRMKTLIWLGFITFFVIGLPTWGFLWINAHATGREAMGESVMVHIFDYLGKNAGGSVGFFVSIVTLLAFALTIQQLRDFHNRITSFSDLLSRVEKLSTSSSNSNPMHMIAYTPALGCLAQQRGDWGRLYNTLIERDNGGAKTKMIVLKSDALPDPPYLSGDLADWHELFKNRRTLRGHLKDDDIAECNQESKRIKDALMRAGNNYIEMAWNDMPGYYAFFTSSQAIVATPMFLPIRLRATDDLKRSLPSTHMIGYQTTDRATIDDLFHEFTYLEAAVRAGDTKGDPLVPIVRVA